MRRTRVTILLGVCLLGVLFCGAAGARELGLTMKNMEFAPGEQVEVQFYAPEAFPDNAWVGLIPSHVAHGKEAENDKYDLAYHYLRGKTSGILVFTAPSQTGRYDFRMNDTDNGGSEVASITFIVKGGAPSAGGAKLSLSKTTFAPGERIEVHFQAPATFPDNAWVGLIPSHVAHGSEAENDRYDLAYHYLRKKTSGMLVFTAPAQGGDYDFRMSDTDNNGKEVTYISFTVMP